MKKSSYLPLAAAGLFLAPSLMMAQAPAGQPAKAATPTATEEKKADSKDAAATATADPSRVDDAAKLPKGVLDQFEKLDSNKDRLISILEFASFSEAEANPARDASSSTSVGKNGTGPGTAGSTTGKNNDAKPQESPNKETRFKELDINADASLSIEEFAAARPANIEASRDASSSTGVGKNGTGPGTAGSTTGSTNASTKNLNGKKEK